MSDYVSAWTPGRVKRLWYIFAAMFIAILAAWWAMGQPWVGYSYGGDPLLACTPNPPAPPVYTVATQDAGVTVTSSAQGCLTGYQWLDATKALSGEHSFLGLTLPGTLTGYMVTLLIVAAAFLRRNRLIVLISAVPLYYTYRSATSLNQLFEGYEKYMEPQMGVSVYQFGYMLALVLFAVGVYFLFKVANEEARIKKKAGHGTIVQNSHSALSMLIRTKIDTTMAQHNNANAPDGVHSSSQ